MLTGTRLRLEGRSLDLSGHLSNGFQKKTGHGNGGLGGLVSFLFAVTRSCYVAVGVGYIMHVQRLELD